jgi:translation initiation factor 3 subunit C
VHSKIEVLVLLVAALFDTRNMGNYMGLDQWSSALTNLFQILNLIQENPGLKIIENMVETVDASDAKQTEAENEVRILGSMLGFTERLDDEFLKSLHFLDPHTQEYVQRLRDENLFLLLAVRVEDYYRKQVCCF